MDKAYTVGADGRGLRQIPSIGAMPIAAIVWSHDQKSIYVSLPMGSESTSEIWKWNVDGSNPERLVDKCGLVTDADPGGRYLLGAQLFGERTGIYEVSLADRKCVPLHLGVSTFTVAFARDGKSFFYAIASSGDITIYRQIWKDGKLIGAPQAAL